MGINYFHCKIFFICYINSVKTALLSLSKRLLTRRTSRATRKKCGATSRKLLSTISRCIFPSIRDIRIAPEPSEIEQSPSIDDVPSNEEVPSIDDVPSNEEVPSMKVLNIIYIIHYVNGDMNNVKMK